MTIIEARAYAATTPESGVSQYELLAGEGLTARSRVLEFGCGPLTVGRHLIDYIGPSNYYAVEPNAWLVQAAVAELRVGVPFRWSVADDFSIPATWPLFDIVYAHSVLSHASDEQVRGFLRTGALNLAPGGKVIVSYRHGEVDEQIDEWQWPGVRYLSALQLTTWAREAGLRHVGARPDLRDRHSAACPDEIHDWVVITR